ncbi:outer membrane protein [Wolbachia endosymbiont of Howardula sp.]|uniref:outer membrane protein n=1 Tax=Wolbachia endosymbiont of Howardula sp. TaxID=2916816 RepID=UPI00217CD0F4|nr:P44/Msp2 family outer membrane protein [Wolbachia endosymbiont of Howardula sp.]UWI83384.1 P44/Msp2 family outer membrane protein [Wolbachia endosymbiont of Howardula sp.]
MLIDLPIHNIDSHEQLASQNLIRKKQAFTENLKDLTQVNSLAHKLSCLSNQKNAWSQITHQPDISEKTKKSDFYISMYRSKVYQDTPEKFIRCITSIREKILGWIDEDQYIHVMLKKMITGEINKILHFNGHIDFYWLNNIAVGVKIGDNTRLDLEAMYSEITIRNSHDITSSIDHSLTMLALLTNIYYNPHVQDTRFTPYVGFGIGPTVFRLQTLTPLSHNSISIDLSLFVYQLKCGINYSILPTLRTCFGYRFFNIPMPIAGAISTHSIEAGLVFDF